MLCFTEGIFVLHTKNLINLDYFILHPPPIASDTTIFVRFQEKWQVVMLYMVQYSTTNFPKI